MPELPEVETMRRGVQRVVGSTIADVARPPCALRPLSISPDLPALRRRLVGRPITGVGRVGKRVVVEVDPWRLVLEPRMTGLVLLVDPPDVQHLRLRLALAGGPAPELLFWDRRGLGTVRLYDLRQFASAFSPPRLGPDALDISAEALAGALGRSPRPIKVALLDQSVLAGVGNIYASEALHAARLHPERRCATLRPAEWRRLHQRLREVLEAAIEAEGSTLGDGTYRNALNRDGSYQEQHRVYARAGERCLSCGRGRIRRTVLAQRATFHCPACQRRPRPSA